MPARTAIMTRAPRAGQLPPGRVPAWPPRAVLDLGAVLTAPGCARAWTREILWEWGAAGLADAAELVASELVTNSVNACAGLGQAAIRLVLTLGRGELAILVRDNHPGVPLAVQPGAEDEGGRGLLIVEHLADRCGWYPLQGATPAKVTWAVLSRASQDAGRCPRGRTRAQAARLRCGPRRRSRRGAARRPPRVDGPGHPGPSTRTSWSGSSRR